MYYTSRFACYVSRLALPALLLLAFALRLHALDFQPLWFDEGKSVFFANQTPWDTALLTAEDIHPPLYYWLLHAWAVFAEWSPFALRFLSAGLSLLAVPLIYQLGRLLSGRRAVGLLAALLLALAPFPIYYAQEARMYALVMTLGLASTVCLLWALQLRPARRLWLAYVAVTAAALYTHYYAAFILLFQAIFVLLYARHHRPCLRRWLVSLAILVLLYAPWLIFSYGVLTSYVTAKVAHEAYPPLPLWTYLADHLSAFSAGTLGDRTVPTIICVALAILGLFHLRKAQVSSLRSQVPSPKPQIPKPKTQNPKPNDLRPATCDLQPATCDLRPVTCDLHPASGILLYLFVPLTAGFVINLFFPFHPPHYERQFLYAAPAFYVLMASGLAGLFVVATSVARSVRRLKLSLRAIVPAGAAVLTLLVVVALDAVALGGFYTTPRYAADDYRPLLDRVCALAQPDDVAVCIYPWQVGYFQSYLRSPRPTLYYAPVAAWSDQPGRMENDLEDLLDDYPRLWFPSYQVAGRGLETRVETYLSRQAHIVEQGWHENNKLLFYTSARPLPAPAPGARFGDHILLHEYQMAAGEFPSAWGVARVRLNWRLLNTVQDRYLVTLRLADANGRTWALSDMEPQAGLWPFTLWEVDEPADDRRALLIPAGAPPGAYSLYLSLHQLEGGQPLPVTGPDGQPRGVELLLGQVNVVSPKETPPLEALPIQRRRQADFGDVRLLGYSIGAGPLRAGQPAPVTLFWQAQRPPAGDYLLAVELWDEAGRNRAASPPRPLGDLYPTGRWRAGEFVVDQYDVTPEAGAGGALRLVAAVYDAASRPVGQPIQLQPAVVIGREPNFNAPSIRFPINARLGDGILLLGYDVEPRAGPVQPGQTIMLTLYWKCLAPMSASYKVFTHLIDPAQPAEIRAQDDAVPGRGSTPTAGWVTGEVLTDVYTLTVKPQTPRGVYRLSVGMYDPATNARLPATGSDGQPLGDHVLLQAVAVEVAYP